MTSSVPVDVTDQLRAAGYLAGPDYNGCDRVYRHRDHLVKVKTFHEHHAHALRTPTGHPLGQTINVWRCTAAIVGEDGKALVLEGGHPAVFGHHSLTRNHETETDLVTEVEKARFRAIEEAIDHYRDHLASGALTGVERRQVAG